MRNYGTELEKNLRELGFKQINKMYPSELRNIIYFDDEEDIVIIVDNRGHEWLGDFDIFEEGEIYFPSGLTVVGKIS
jgi:hypothetical protein